MTALGGRCETLEIDVDDTHGEYRRPSPDFQLARGLQRTVERLEDDEKSVPVHRTSLLPESAPSSVTAFPSW